MKRVEPGSDRWIELVETARLLQQRGALTYRRLRQEAGCSGEVAGRVLAALRDDEELAAGADGEVSLQRASSSGEAFDGPVDDEWNAAVLTLKRLVLKARRELGAQVAASRDAELRRLQEVEQELRADRDELVDDLNRANAVAQEASARADDASTALDVARRDLDELRGRCDRAEEEVGELRAKVLLQQERAQADAVAVAEQLARLQVDLEAARARADRAEAETARQRDVTLEAKSAASRLEGELAATERARKELQDQVTAASASRLRRTRAQKPMATDVK
jgi:hypothetical protein